MRKQFSHRLHEEMSANKDIFVLTGDLGYGLWDRIRIDYPQSNVRSRPAVAARLAMVGETAQPASWGDVARNMARRRISQC